VILKIGCAVVRDRMVEFRLRRQFVDSNHDIGK
jgi:hypothetical protein